MKINSREELDALPDGTIVRVMLTGEDWDDEAGHVEQCVKVGNKMFKYTTYYTAEDAFNDRDDDNLEVEIFKYNKDQIGKYF